MGRASQMLSLKNKLCEDDKESFANILNTPEQPFVTISNSTLDNRDNIKLELASKMTKEYSLIK